MLTWVISTALIMVIVTIFSLMYSLPIFAVFALTLALFALVAITIWLTRKNAHSQHLQSQLDVAQIVHEFNTPITRLLLTIGIAQSKSSDAAPLKRVEAEALKLEGLCAELLTLIKVNHEQSNNQECFNIESDIQALAELLQQEAQQQHKQLSLSFAPICQGKTITLNKTMLQRAVDNLARNAIRHAKSSINITVNWQDNQLEIAVTDDGPGIEPEKLSSILQPFTQANQSSYRSHSWGLGLAIARASISKLEGKLSLNNQSNGGLRATLKLPCVMESAE